MRSMTKSWSLVVAGLGALIASAHAIQTKSGNVSGQTWTADTYWVSGSLTVNNGTTLTLEPGVVVKFAPGTGASVYGTISAQGTEADPIVITSRDDDATARRRRVPTGSPSRATGRASPATATAGTPASATSRAACCAMAALRPARSTPISISSSPMPDPSSRAPVNSARPPASAATRAARC